MAYTIWISESESEGSESSPAPVVVSGIGRGGAGRGRLDDVEADESETVLEWGGVLNTGC